jgi:peptidoglycan/LPS O-acetylase OafA/YrhL
VRRVAELDAIRGLAALAVVVFHLWYIGPMEEVGVFAVLQYAVDVFFILSGFLITTIILEHGGHRGFLRSFYARRFLRTWPIYYLTLLVAAASARWWWPRPLSEWLPFYLTYTQNLSLYGFQELPQPVHLNHCWTLAIEEQFYLLWPLLLLLLGRRWLVPMCLGLLALSAAARGAGFYDRLLISRCDGFALGALLAALSRGGFMERHPGGWRLVSALAAGASLIALAATWRVRALHLTFMNLAFAASLSLVLGSVGHRALAPLRDRRLVYLGVISYGVYLYHPLVFAVVDCVGRHWLLDIGKIGLVIVVAGLSWAWVEQPILRLKDRFEYEAEPRSAAPDLAVSIAEAVNNG